MDKDEDVLNALALANFQQFLLEFMVATEMAGRPDGADVLASLGATMLDRIQYRTTSRDPSPDGEDQADMTARMFLIARRFFERAEQRRAQIAKASGGE